MTEHATDICIIAFKAKGSVSSKEKQALLKYSFTAAISVKFLGMAIMYDAFLVEYKGYNEPILNGMTQQILRRK